MPERRRGIMVDRFASSRWWMGSNCSSVLEEASSTARSETEVVFSHLWEHAGSNHGADD